MNQASCGGAELVAGEMVTGEMPPGEIARPAAGRAAGSLYYGWIMLPLSMAALIASSPGQTFGVSIFNEPMRLSLGLSHGQLAAAYMLGTLLGSVPIVWVGSLMDRHGMRRSMLVAVTLFSLACLTTALAQGWMTLVLAFFLLRTLGPGALAFLSSNTLAYWFDRRLGAVEGLRQLGMAGAMAVIPAVNLWLVSHFGWRLSYALLGAAIWLLLFPTFTLLFRNQPRDVGQNLDGHPEPEGEAEASRLSDWETSLTLQQALRSRSFWIVSGGTSAFSLIHTAVFFCLVPIFQELQLSEDMAASMLLVFALCLAATQLVAGTLADRMQPQALMAAGLAGLAAGVGLLCYAHTSTAVHGAGVLLGVSQGLFFGSTQPLWARYFGRAHLGKIRGVLMTLIVAASSLGPLIAGLTKDWTGGFSPALIGFAIAPLPLAVLSLLATSPRGKRPTSATRTSEPACR